MNAIVKSEERLQQIRSLFDLDGITVFSDRGNRLVCRNGNYMAEAPDGRLGFEDEGYLSLFGDDDIFVESNMPKPGSLCCDTGAGGWGCPSVPVQKRRNSLYNGQF